MFTSKTSERVSVKYKYKYQFISIENGNTGLSPLELAWFLDF